MSRFILFVFVLGISFFNSFSQTRFMLISGKEISNVFSYDVKEERINFIQGLDSLYKKNKIDSYLKRLKKNKSIDDISMQTFITHFRDSLDTISKQRRVDRFKVFSVIKQGGNEKVIYEPQSENEDPSIDWVRNYIKGEQFFTLHQKQHWNSKTGTWVKGTNPINKICGFATGFGGSILSFYGIAVPALYTTVVGQFSVKLPPATDIDESLRNDEAFRYGYQKKLRNRRIRQGFLASMAGFAAGILTFTFTR